VQPHTDSRLAWVGCPSLYVRLLPKTVWRLGSARTQCGMEGMGAKKKERRGEGGTGTPSHVWLRGAVLTSSANAIIILMGSITLMITVKTTKHQFFLNLV